MIYLGPAGNLQAIRHPAPGYSFPLSILGGTHQLLSGARVRDVTGRKRTWQMLWRYLTDAEFGLLEGLALGVYGPGPFRLVDVAAGKNVLSPNVSSGTDRLLTAEGFTAGVSSTDASTAWNLQGGPFPKHGTRTLRVPVGTTAAQFSDVTAIVDKVPVVPGIAYTFSAYLSLVTTNFGVYVQLHWQDAAGAALSNRAGNAITGGAGRSSAAEVAPAGAAFAFLTAKLNAANSSGAIQQVYLDGLQFEQSTAPSDWAYGVGLPTVAIDALDHSVPIVGQHDCSLTLLEV